MIILAFVPKNSNVFVNLRLSEMFIGKISIFVIYIKCIKLCCDYSLPFIVVLLTVSRRINFPFKLFE